jgi:hypothetical protein
MVEPYAHLSEAHTRSVVESMNEKMFGEKQEEDVPKTAVKDGEVLWRSAAFGHFPNNKGLADLG